MQRCRSTVHWLDLDLDGHCIKPEHHAGPHLDGCWLWDSFGLRVPSTVEQVGDRAERVAAEAIGARNG